MCGCVCFCFSFIMITIVIMSFTILKFFSYYSEFGFYFLLEKIKYWSIFSLEILATFLGYYFLLHMLFDLAKDILKLKGNNVNQKDVNIIKQNLHKILKNIILNIIVLSIFYSLYLKFNSEYYKTVMVLYISVILGFTASFPLEENNYEINLRNEWLLISKSIGNSSLLFGSYLFYNFYLKKSIINLD